ncbi:MAG TPA: mechanosensitive ion channel domain-containing protein [Sphingomonas sp.]|uniref:mechanosensitive ion channel family protein n=1 Tax=Sphingomonas sp. TaxID=28214 RepID=UPI002C5484F8|nr:mechanosensitive ion channel domain-containing protein [Sphingomonas sp.]HMI19656.1 mechanosensitive ion channel domain-containing protein [Sphingomonas sp.]
MANTNVTAPLRLSKSSVQMLSDETIQWILSHYLQVGIALGFGAAICIVLYAVRILGIRLCQRQGSLTHWPQTVGRVFAATKLWFIVLFAAKLVDGYADPPPMVWQTISVMFTIAVALQGALWVRELILGVVEHRAGGSDATGAQGSAVGVIRLLVTIALFAIASVLILDNLGVNVTGLIAGLGIGGIAIGLAAKGIFDDLFSALSIIFDKPFQRGDQIRWDKTTGTVEEIGLKTTRVRATTGEEVVISNTNLLSKELHNMARLNRRRVEFTLHIAYHTPPKVLGGIQAMVKAAVEAQDKCKLVRCGISDLTLPTIEIQVQFDVLSQSWDKVFQARHEIAIGLLAAFEGAKIEFAGPDGKSITPPVNAPPPGTAGAPEVEASGE